MKRNLFFMICLIAFMAVGFTATREKTEKIGKFTWYTEKTPWEEILKASQKTGKPVLVVFDAEWIDPTQELKKKVLASDAFKSVADQVVLTYIEQASTDGDAYCKKFNVRIFPTFKLFSKEGIMLDNGTFKRTVEGFLGWIKEVKAGNNVYELSKKLEKDPNNRDLILKTVGRMGMSDKRDKLNYLRKALSLNPDFKDPLSQKIYEKIAVALLECIPLRQGRQEYLAENGKLFQDILNAYYPDKFKYDLKGNDGLVVIFNWFVHNENPNKVLSIFNDFLKRKGNKPDPVKDIDAIGWAVPSYLNTGNFPEAEKWLLKIKNYSKPSKSLKDDQRFVYYYPLIFRNIIGYLENIQKTKEAEKYVLMFYTEMSRFGLEKVKEEMVLEYAPNYKALADKSQGDPAKK